MERVVAPPYDVIGPELHQRLEQSDPYNVVRLILTRQGPDDDEAQAKYTRASQLLSQWERDGVLVPTARPAWYPYEMRFTYQGHPRRVRGVICQVDLEPWGGSILPHEATMASSIADRQALIRAVRANLSPVYALARGPCEPLAALLDAVAADPPDRVATDDEGVEHRMWVLEDGSGITDWLAGEQLLIADGHHRYSVALAYQDEMRAQHGPGPWDQMMMLIVDAGHEDPPVLPIHRIVVEGQPKPTGSPVRDLAEVLAVIRDDDLTFGVVQRENGAVVHRVGALRGQPPTVCALHDQILGESRVRFLPDAASAEAAVLRGEAPAAFFLPSTKVDRIRSVIERGERLPQKSTYFWPKPRTGMVIRPIR